ncbi:hypothetical protein K3G63_21135 [Hymenobacter sp. HSC-4F20]|uniref:hypothetical protein n=1 Tax=Hymenobacter sp. HSC-4F20 TaxID=2864135 RepID=UPI001C739C29|nr:hypothetical protein [Hymenobacter sp. HSC-4F20]MBX0292961.1 hypothetical protein [Hymenobacter sp. HSC-4F20]
MKVFFTVMWLLVAISSGQAQAVLIHGTATTLEGYRVQLVVNDTLRRLWRTVPDQPSLSPEQEELVEKVTQQDFALRQAGHYVLETDSAGHFRVSARPQDSVTFTAYGHVSQTLGVRDLLRQPAVQVRLLPRPCQEYVPCQEAKPAHFVFIGRKQTVARAQQPNYCNRFSMDGKFTARYQVLENIYNTLPDTVVSFAAYDHYGWPGFSRHETVLLFVSRYCGDYIQEKYQYYPLYRTTDGRWAAPVDTDDLTHPMARKGPKPTKLTFASPVEVDVTKLDAEQRKEYYPAPYYRVEGQKAIAVYGNYVDELLQIKKSTVLKARGIKLK